MTLAYSLLTANVYTTDLFNLLKNVEGAEIDIYLDTKNIPSIGIGFNIKDNIALRNEVLTIFGLGVAGSAFRNGLTPAERIIEDSYINKITNLINHNYPNHSAATIAKLYEDLNAIMDERYNRLSSANQALTQNFFGFENNSDTGDMRTIFDLILPSYEKKVTDWLAGIPQSKERVALTSLAFNQTDANPLIGKKLKAAIISGNRAEAWYEIRYNSNSDTVQANRRYKESNIFGLYGDSSQPSFDPLKDSKDAYRMFTLHRDEILRYEKTYSPANIANPLTHQIIGTISDQLTSAKTILLSDLQLQPNPDIAYAFDAWLAQGHAVESFDPTDIYLDPGRANTFDSISLDRFGNVSAFIDPLTHAVNLRDSIIIGESNKGSGDVLIGGDGRDFIIGGDGNDTITGDKGNDILAGGDGNDTYIINTGDGNDTIEDKSGVNTVIFNDKKVGVFIKQQDGTLKSADGKFTGTLGSDLIITDADSGATLTLNKDFQEGDFGIHFVDEFVDPVATNDINGDLSPNDTKPDVTGIQAVCDAEGNPIDGQAQPYADMLAGTAGNDHIIGGALNDDIGGGNSRGAGEDWVEGGAGNDYLWTGLGNDLIEGGSESDILSGGDGNDQLFGDVKIDIDTAITNGNTDSGSGQKGDWLAGGAGDDTLVGSSGNDVLSGGGGKDLLSGGAGDDYILGDSDYFPTFFWADNPSYTDITNNINWYHSTSQTFDWTVTLEGKNYLFQPLAPGFDTTDPEDSGDDLIYAGAGNDFVWAGKGDDVVYGEDGNDTINGEAGNDVIFGGAGDDKLVGDGSYVEESLQGNDYIDGGDGNDTIQGGGGDDVLFGGAGNDLIFGDDTGQLVAGNNYLDGEDGNDTLQGGAGDDQMYGGAGDDNLYGGTGADYLDGGDGNDVLQSEGAGSALYGGAGDDELDTFGGSSYLDGEEGNNTLWAGLGNNTLIAGAGNDTLTGAGGNNYLDGGEGNNLIVAQDGGGNTLYGEDGDDTLSAAGGGNYLDAGEGTNSLFADGGGNTLLSGAGDDELSSAGGNSYLDGGDGNNLLIVDGGGNTLYSGGGNDTLSAGGGSNYLYGGDGTNTLIAAGGNNTLIGGADSDTLSAAGGGSTLDGGSGDDNLVADGGGNTLYGGDGNDVLIAYGGNNTLDGGAGRDLYVFEAGFGTEHISDSGGGAGGNTVVFNFNLAASGIVYGLGSLKISFANGDVLHIDGFDPNDPVNTCSIDTFQFSDQVLSIAEVIDMAGAAIKPPLDGATISGTPGDDVLQGTDKSEYIYGLEGNDVINAGAGSDIILAGAGDDTINGGSGSDQLYGGYGNDTYVFNLGDGAETINDANLWMLPDGTLQADMNVLRFGAGITPDMITPTLDRVTNLIKFDLGNGDSITIGKSNDEVIRQLQFADGSSLWISEFFAQYPFQIKGDDSSEIIDGTTFNDILQGNGGNDVLRGGEGNDTYIYNLGDGADTIIDSSPSYIVGGNDNVLRFGAGITPEMITVRKSGDSCVLDLGNGDSIDIGSGAFSDYIIHGFNAMDPFNYFGVQTLQFADGTRLSVENFVMQYGLDTLGTSGNDTLVGNDVFYNGTMNNNISIPDRFYGGTGNDTLIGGGGGDIYVFNRGDGADTIIDSAQGSTLNKQWNAWLINDANTLSFGAGITASDITARYQHGDVSSHDTVVLDLGGGDSINIGTSPSADLAIQNLKFADGSSISIQDFFNQHGLVMIGTDGAEYLPGAGDFSNYIQGLGGDDRLNTGNGNDTLDGGLGSDVMIGGAGNDTYIYNLGDGADVISDTGLVETTDVNGQPLQLVMPNTLAFGAGITSDIITPVWDKNTLSLDLGNGDSIAIGAWKAFDDNTRYFDIAVQNLQFSDDTELSVQDFLAQRGLQSIGDATVLIGTPGDDVLSGEVGDDVISGELGNDILNGGDGNDVLFGRAGDDMLDSGAGNDLLQGGAGDDLYLFGYGSGQDVIVDNDGWDAIQFASGLSLSELQFAKAGLDMRISLQNSPDSILIKDWFSGNSSVSSLQFVDNYWGTVDLVSIGMDLAAKTEVGSSGDDVLVGSIYNDALQGAEGNDTLIGGKGNDTYIFNTGDGADTLYELTGNDTIVFGADITPDMLWLNMGVISTWGGSNPTVFPDPNADLMANEDQRQVLNIQVGNLGDSIQVMTGKGAIEHFTFADGSSYTLQQLAQMQGTVEITDIDGQAGQHRDLDGLGVAGDFLGSVANDNMLGGLHDDIYRFGMGDGQDVIADFGGINEVAFYGSITADDLSWNYDPTGVTPFRLSVGSNGDSIAILNGEKGAIQRFSFEDGSVITFDELIAAQGGIDLVSPATAGQVIDMPYDWNSNNLIVGDDGADTINVFERIPNMIVAGKGDDIINMGTYNDTSNTLIFNLGDGHDTVVFGEGSASVTTLVFGVGIDPASVIVEVADGLQWGLHVQDMRIKYGNEGDEVIISGSIAKQGEGGGLVPNIARVKFVDGTEWSFADLMDLAQPSVPDFVGERIVASPFNPILVGSGGNDTFVIGDQPATYQIIDGGTNVVELGWSLPALQGSNNIADQTTFQDAHWSFQTQAVVDTAGYRLSYDSGALLIGFSNGVSLQIDGFNPDDPFNSTSINQFNFADGTVLSLEQLLAQGFDVMGSVDGADALNGTTLNDRIQGLGGDDTLVGGLGSDVLAGGAGNDTYVYNSGDGADVIVDHDGHWDGQNYVWDNNVLQFGANVDVASVTVKRDPDNGQVYLDLGNGDSINIGTATDLAVQSVQFAVDGTSWNTQYLISNMLIEANPNALPDTVLPLSLDTSITYAATLADGTALPVWLSFDSATQTFSGVPSNWDVGILNLKINATDSFGNSLDRDFVLNVLNVNDAPTVVHSIHNQSIIAGQVYSYTLPNVVASSSFLKDAGDTGTADPVLLGDYKYFSGSGGNDTYSFARGDGLVYIYDSDSSPMDTVNLAGVLPADISVTSNQYGEVIISVIGTADSLILGAWLSSDMYKIEQLVFADGTVWGVNDIMSRISTTPTSGNDYIIGDNGNEIYYTQGGDDYVLAGIGNDLIVSGAGNDFITGGGGSDILSGGSGADDIESDWTYTDSANDLLMGGAGDDFLGGSISNDLLIGGQGNDYVSAYDGNNVILFNKGDGNDQVEPSSSGVATQANTVSLGGGINFSDLSFTIDGENLILNTGNGESIAFLSWFGANWTDSTVFGNHDVNRLQVIADAMIGYDAQSTDPLMNKRIQQFDFAGLVNEFEAALAADPTITSWQLAPYLASYSLGGSDTSAIGGDMAFVYGKNGNLNGLSEAGLRAQLTAGAFGSTRQTLTDAPESGVTVFDDIDFIHGDRLIYSASLVDGSALPSWLSFDPASQTFSGIPVNSDAGVIQVAVTATDTGGLSATTNFALTVTSAGTVNAAPLAVADAVTVSEDTAVSVFADTTLLVNDIDPDITHGDALKIISVTESASGASVSLMKSVALSNGTSKVRYDIGNLYQYLAQGQTATDTFSYTISDNAGATSTATVSLTITGVNDAAVTANDSATVEEDGTQIASGNVLANDSDIDQGTVLSIANAGTLQGAYGQLVLNAGGGYSYELDNTSAAVQGLMAGQVVTETFSYEAFDGYVSTPAILTVTVTGTNDGPVAIDDNAAVDADSLLTIDVNTLLANDTDADIGNTKTLVGVASISTLGASVSLVNGQVVYEQGGLFSSLKIGETAVDSFTYSMTDSAGAISAATVNVTVAGNGQLNIPPLAVGDAVMVSEDAAVTTIAATELLANDTDPGTIHGDVLSIVGVSQAASGSIVSLLNGNVQYDIGSLYQSLAQGQTATDTFSYTISDLDGATSTATVTMTITGVNDAAVTADDVANVQEDIVISASGNVLANDSDIDQGTVLSVANAGTLQGSYGQLVLNTDGGYSYVLDNTSSAVQGLMAGQVVTEIFNYEAFDGYVSTPSILTVTVAGTNDGPVAIDDSATVGEDSLLSVNVDTLLINDTDADIGDSKTLVGVANTSALGASVSLSNGQVVYDQGNRFNNLMAGQSIVDTFTYTMTDSAGASSTATVNVTVVGVNDGPTANADSAVTDEDTVQTTLTVASLLANDTDPDTGDTLALAGFDTVTALGNVISKDANGNLVFDIGNRYQYLAQGQTVNDTFNYTITDTTGAMSTAQVTLTIVGSNDAAVTMADIANVQEDVTITATGNVLANDSDVDQGTTLTVASAGTFNGTYGQLILNANGSYSYALNNSALAVQSLAAGQVVTETFAYQANDGFVNTPSSLTLTITGTNDAPIVAIPLMAQSIAQGQLFTYALPANSFTDIDQGDKLSYTATLANGTSLPSWLSFNAATQTFSGTPGATDLANLSITVIATDLGGLAANSSFALTVNTPVITGTCGNDCMMGTDFDNTMYGLGGNDHLRGLGGDDILDGGTGADTMLGGKGNDTYVVDISCDTVTENANEGTDTVQSRITYTLGANVENLTLTGASAINGTGNSLSNVMLGNAAANTMIGGSGNDLLNGGAGNDILKGDGGNDILEGADGNDTLSDTSGKNLFNGGAGTDKLTGNSGNELFIGGRGNDTINTGSGADIIAFNKGDGQDTVVASTGADNTISLGGGIQYANLAMSKSGNNLIFSAGNGDQITLQNWYASSNNHSVKNLQVVLDDATYKASSTDTLLNHQVQTFDFNALASNFDRARAVNPTLTTWSMADALLTAHLAGSDTAALGGDLAYQYNLNNSLAGIGLASAQTVMNDASFGMAAQTLTPLSTLQQGGVKLG